MDLGNNIEKAIWQFDPISLDQMDKVRLMRRTDTKFIFSIEHLPALLKQAIDNYFMVEIKDEREQIYETTYFDTDDYKMYQTHHNGKLNRHKVRIRHYVYTGQEFLEIKRKNNKGETIKKRIEHADAVHKISVNGSKEFVDSHTPYNASLLKPTLGNKFVRLTLVNKDFSERITLDYNIRFTDLKYNTDTHNQNICIAEVKKGRDNKTSPFLKLLRDNKINSMGFSKYCMGIAMLNPEVKSNNFKQRIRIIEKT